MFENLKALLPSGTYRDAYQKVRAVGLVEKCMSELRVMGVDTSQPDQSNTGTLGNVLYVLRTQVAGVTYASAYNKLYAVGLIDKLTGELAATGLAVTV